jgi:DNA-binding transcriptional regulator LsrR (DeoR family)
MFEQAAGELAAGAVQASRRLQELLASGDNIALGAAKAILDSALRLRQSTELETRLTALEGHLGDNQESSSTTGTAGKQAA